MYYLHLNVFIIFFLTWSSPVFSQTPLQAAISQLNPCATNCISRAASLFRCGATDFSCQCNHQASIIGSSQRTSPQSLCLLRACGASNTTDVRNTFNNICDLEAASAAIGNNGNQAPASSQVQASVNPPATTAQVNTPPSTPILTLTPFTGSQSTPLVLSDAEASTSAAQAPASASFTPTTESSPIDLPISAPSTSIAESSPLAAQTSASASIPPASPSSVPSFTAIQASDPASTPANQASSIAESSPNDDFTNPQQPTSGTPLPPVAIAGIAILVLGFVATILGLAFVQLRRRKRRSYIVPRTFDEKIRPTTEDGPPDTRDSNINFKFAAPPMSSGRRWLPWINRKPTFTPATMNIERANPKMGVERGPRSTLEIDERPKSRGKGFSESGSGNANKPPSQFPMLSIGTAQVVRSAGSPTQISIKRTGTGGSTGSAGSGQQPLKSAMKKPRERPKSRPLMTGDGEKDFKFEFDPLGSNPRTPT